MTHVDKIADTMCLLAFSHLFVIWRDHDRSEVIVIPKYL